MAGRVGGRMNRTIALIPARQGSKRVPGKNRAMVAGRSLVAHAIECAKEVGVFSETYVSTDDREVIAVAVALGVGVIERPRELAEDDVVLDRVAVHALEHLDATGRGREAVCLMTPTAALRTVRDVRGAVQLLWTENADFVCTAAEYEHHPYYALEVLNGRFRPHFGKDVFSKDRRELPTLYRPIAVARVARWEAVLQHRTTFGPGMLPYLLDSVSAVDVDTPLDLTLVEVLFSQRHQEGG